MTPRRIDLEVKALSCFLVLCKMSFRHLAVVEEGLSVYSLWKRFLYEVIFCFSSGESLPAWYIES